MRSLIYKLIAVFSISFLISLFIFIFYYLSEKGIKTDMLTAEEDNIIRITGPPAKKELSFCYYPDSSPIPQGIAWDKNNLRLGKKSLRLIFKRENGQGYCGVRMNLPLNLNIFLEKGHLEFWVKGKNSYGLIKEFKICLENNSAIDGIASVTLPLEIDKDWRKISIPLKDFVLIKDSGSGPYHECNRFKWNIWEFLFWAGCADPDRPIELFINDFKIMNNGEVINEVF